MLRTTPRPATRLTLAMGQTIALLALPQAGLVRRLAMAAAENPALRMRAPKEAGWLPPLLDPDGISAPGDSLVSHVLGRIRALDLDRRSTAIALALTGALEPTGWLGTGTAAIARDCGVPEPEVLEVLARVQRIEPGGLFARTLAECLTLQAEQEGALDPAMRAVLADLPGLAAGGAAALAQASGLAPADVLAAARRIRSFDPKPGLAFAGPMLPAPPADLLLRCGAAGWEAVVNPHIVSAEVRPGQPGSAAAAALCRAVEGRMRIALAICGELAQRQRGWLEGGAPAAVTARDLAGATGLHVATVNRCLANVTARMPAGTRPLRALLARPSGPDGAAAVRIRARLAELLAQAGPARPSDAELSRRLAQEGLAIARRTVAKYRAGLG